MNFLCISGCMNQNALRCNNTKCIGSISKPDNKIAHFCCCAGSFCNLNVTVAPPTLAPPMSNQSPCEYLN